GLDLFGGGWCACSGCATLTPSDQALRVAQAVADRLAGAGRIFHLAYHDTLTPPRGRPGPQVWAEFAPRERCYAHALDDAACATNAPYWDALARHLEVFQGRVDVFEYYGDALLFGGCAVPLVEVIARDLESYAASGVRGVSCLLFGSYSLWAYGVNVEAFARGMLRPDAARGAREAYSRRWYGTAAEPMGRYLTRLERLVAGAVQHGDVRLPPRERNRARAAHDALAPVPETAASTQQPLEELAHLPLAERRRQRTVILAGLARPAPVLAQRDVVPIRTGGVGRVVADDGGGRERTRRHGAPADVDERV